MDRCVLILVLLVVRTAAARSNMRVISQVEPIAAHAAATPLLVASPLASKLVKPAVPTAIDIPDTPPYMKTADSTNLGPADIADTVAAVAATPSATTAVWRTISMATCVDQMSSSQCRAWRAKGYCALDFAYNSKFVGTELCPRTCGRCGERCGREWKVLQQVKSVATKVDVTASPVQEVPGTNT